MIRNLNVCETKEGRYLFMAESRIETRTTLVRRTDVLSPSVGA